MAIASRTPSSGETIGTANSGSRSAISRVSASAARSAAVLAPGVGDHRRPAPIEIGGREAGEIGEVDQVALGHHRAGDHALRRLDQRALVVERDQERQLAQRAPGGAAALQQHGHGAGGELPGLGPIHVRVGAIADQAVGEFTISGVTLEW